MVHVVMKQEKKKKHSPTLKKAPPAKSLTHDAFITSRKLFSTDCFDALHKRVYRKGQASFEAIKQRLIRKAYYIDESIDYKGLGK